MVERGTRITEEGRRGGVGRSDARGRETRSGLERDSVRVQRGVEG